MSLKVFDLCCDQTHHFEGWFASAEDCEAQAHLFFFFFPVCHSTKVERKLSAPYVNRSGSMGYSAPEISEHKIEQVKAAVLQGLRNMITQAEDVGERFTEEAIKIHHGDAEERSIRGQASPEQRDQLLDEGIDVFAIPEELDPKKQHWARRAYLIVPELIKKVELPQVWSDLLSEKWRIEWRALIEEVEQFRVWSDLLSEKWRIERAKPPRTIAWQT